MATKYYGHYGNVIYVGGPEFGRIENVLAFLGNQKEFCGQPSIDCASGNCYLYLWIRSTGSITIDELNSFYFNEIEGFCMIELGEGTTRAEIYNLCVKGNNKPVKLQELLFHVIRWLRKKQYTTIMGTVNIDNPSWKDIVEQYIDHGFQHPCIYYRCPDQRYRYDHPYLGFIYVGTVGNKPEITTNADNLKDEFTPIQKFGAIKKNCLINPQEMTMTGYELKDYIAQGGYAVVYQVKIRNDSNYVVKIQVVDPREQGNGTNLSMWNREMEWSEKLSKGKYNDGRLYESGPIGPKFIAKWLCEGGNRGISVTEKWTGQLQVGECMSNTLFFKLEKQIQVLRRLGLVHGDILEKNILVNRDSRGQIIDVTLADFGTLNTPDGWRRFNLFKEFYNYHKNPGNSTREYYIDNNITWDQVRREPELLDNALTYYLRKRCLFR